LNPKTDHNSQDLAMHYWTSQSHKLQKMCLMVDLLKSTQIRLENKRFFLSRL